MNHVSLFSGIGGQSIACDWLGIETVGFCEIDGWNRRVLAKHWPHAGFHSDVKTLTGDVVQRWTRFRPLDLLTASWPCQPFSVAGKRLGRDDHRALWPEVARLVGEARPAYFLGENVAGIVTMELDTVLADLEARGYAARAVVVPACAVNALHRRDRLWVMAYRDGDDADQPQPVAGSRHPSITGACGASMADATCERDEWCGASRERGTELADGGSGMADTTARRVRRRSAPGEPGQPAQRGEEFSDASAHLRGASGDDRSEPPDRSGERGHGESETPRTVDAGPNGLPAGLVRRPAARSVEPDLIRAMWADGTWEAGLPRVVAEEPERRQKLQAAGNAIVPLVAYEILSVMIGESA